MRPGARKHEAFLGPWRCIRGPGAFDAEWELCARSGRRRPRRDREMSAWKDVRRGQNPSQRERVPVSDARDRRACYDTEGTRLPLEVCRSCPSTSTVLSRWSRLYPIQGGGSAGLSSLECSQPCPLTAHRRNPLTCSVPVPVPVPVRRY